MVKDNFIEERFAGERVDLERKKKETIVRNHGSMKKASIQNFRFVHQIRLTSMSRCKGAITSKSQQLFNLSDSDGLVRP